MTNPPSAISPQKFWTNRIIVLTGLVFLSLTLVSGQLFNPRLDYLVAFGAKEPVAMALGQWWRLLTPIFLHIGLIHFAFNMFALKYIGRYIEQLIGAGPFVAIYLGTGVIGNIASSLTHVEIGAGASGAIFGLIGVGVVFEWLVAIKELHWRPGSKFSTAEERQGWRGEVGRLSPGPFTSMALLNIGLAVVINFVLAVSMDASVGFDNAAHLGGLFSGMALGLALLWLRPNRLLKGRPWWGGLLIAAVLAIAAAGAYVVSSPSWVAAKLLAEARAEATAEPQRAYSYLSRALLLLPSDPRLHFERGRLLIRHGEVQKALDDFSILERQQNNAGAQYKEDLLVLAEELAQQGQRSAAAAVTALAQRLVKEETH